MGRDREEVTSETLLSDFYKNKISGKKHAK